MGILEDIFIATLQLAIQAQAQSGKKHYWQMLRA